MFSALAYYYDNRDTFEQLEGAASDARREGERRTTRLLDEVDHS